MSKFMTWLNDQLDGIKVGDIVPPNKELGRMDEVIGQLDNVTVRKLFALRARLREELTGILKKSAHVTIDLLGAEGEHDEATCPGCALLRAVRPLRAKVQIVDELFWASLREEVSEEGNATLYSRGGAIGICRGWQIVSVAPQVSFMSGKGMGVGSLEDLIDMLSSRR